MIVSSSGQFVSPFDKYRLRAIAGVSQDIHELAAAGLTAELQEELTARPSRVHEVDSNNCTPLHLACKYNHIKAAFLLISFGADIFQKNNKKKLGFVTPHKAAVDYITDSYMKQRLVEAAAKVPYPI